MIIGFSALFVILGSMLMLGQYYMPPLPSVIMSLHMCGMIFVAIGIVILIARDRQTGGGLWLDLPTVGSTISIHSQIANKRLDPNAKFLKLRDIGLGMLKGKNMVFKDTGGGFRIAGHDVRRTHEKLAADLPEWLGQYIHSVITKYGVKDGQQLRELYMQLQKIEEHGDLRKIELLKPVMKDDKKAMQLMTMDIDDLKQMKELLFNGETAHMEDVEKFIKLTSPQELDTWIDQRMNKGIREQRRYKDPGAQIDWNRWLPALGVFMIIGVLATVILLSYLD